MENPDEAQVVTSALALGKTLYSKMMSGNISWYKL